MILVASTCLTGAVHWRTSWIMAQVAISMLRIYSIPASLAIHHSNHLQVRMTTQMSDEYLDTSVAQKALLAPMLFADQ